MAGDHVGNIAFSNARFATKEKATRQVEEGVPQSLRDTVGKVVTEVQRARTSFGAPRDAHREERLADYVKDGGIWDCTHCYYCVEVCPKGVAPMEWILELRREAEAAGHTNHNGVRHSKVFAESVKEAGWLDEAKLAMDSMGSLKEKLSLVPVGLRSLLHGKMPPTGPLHYKRPGAEHVKRIFEELEAKE